MTINISNIPVPAAVRVGDWALDNGTARHFDGTTRIVSADVTGSVDFRIAIAGDQNRGGSVEPYVHINGDHSLSAQGSRDVASALVAAADEMDDLYAHAIDGLPALRMT